MDKYGGVTADSDRCWRDVTSAKPPPNVELEAGDNGIDKLTKAKIAFDEQVIGLISWALTAFILIMVVVGFVFPGRDIISYMRDNKEA